MNCIPEWPNRSGRLALLAGALLFAACGVPASESADATDDEKYRVHYDIEPDPASATVLVSMHVEHSRRQLRELRFAVDGERLSDLHADGELRVEDGEVVWRPAPTSSRIEWRVRVNHARSGGGFDAWLGNDWGLFRAEDILPRARTRTLRGARSETSLSFRLPDGWSAITEYRERKGTFRVERTERRFDQPTGWIAIGKLGIRREMIAGVRVAIAAPEEQAVRRMDMLALLHWTLPELAAILPDALTRLTVVSAGEPMWRGGLSAPASLFVHADRPLISENATSTLLHEVMHAALSFRTRRGYDWITEGLAEYYSIVLLHRGGAISTDRFRKALDDQRQWSKRADSLCDDVSSGATTALAVTLFAQLERELEVRSKGRAGLDDLLRRLVASEATIDLAMLAGHVEALTGATSDTLHIEQLPGCRKMAAEQATH